MPPARWLFPTLLALACAPDAGTEAAEEQQAIVGGTLDTTDHSVVAVKVTRPYRTPTNVTCSGSVISPHVVLTAGHCVDPAENGPDAGYFINVSDDIYASPSHDLYSAKDTHLDPSFTGGASGAGSHDLGVVVTQQPLPVAPLPLNRAPLAGTLVGATVRIIGYGLSDPAHYDAAHYGKRRQASVQLSSVGPEFIEFGNADAGTCVADSGGPTVLRVDGGELIIALHEAVISASCDGLDRDTRIDPFFDEFIGPQVEAADPGFLGVADAGATPDAGQEHDAGQDADAGDRSDPTLTAMHGGCSATAGLLLPAALLLCLRRRALRAKRDAAALRSDAPGTRRSVGILQVMPGIGTLMSSSW